MDHNVDILESQGVSSAIEGLPLLSLEENASSSDPCEISHFPGTLETRDNNVQAPGAGDVPHFTSHPPQLVPTPSEAVGVTYHKKNKQWEAHLWVQDRQLGKRKKKGSQIFLGNFQTKDEAKCAHDKAALKLDVVRETANGKPYALNFPESTYSAFMALHEDWSERDFVWKIRRLSHKFSKGKSGMKGVTVRSRKCGGTWYEAKISQTMGDGVKRTYNLGKFDCEEEAGRAYDRAMLFVKGVKSDCVTNFRPSEYSESEVQAAGERLQIMPAE